MQNLKIDKLRKNKLIDKLDKCNSTDYPEGHYVISDLIDNQCFEFSSNNIPNYIVIKQLVINRAEYRFGSSFKFRQNQLDVIISIIISFFTKDNYIMEAPTGSGKSIIALLVADVLNYYFGLEGYILISDLSLLDQYTRDVNMYFPDFKFLKGQDNYYCDENQLTYPFGVCRLQGLSYYEINELPCAETCPYINARKNSISSGVTLMTYQAWLIQRNYIPYIMQDRGGHPFRQRDFTICDEAHKLADIIQDHFSPIINKDDGNKLAEIVQDAKIEFGPQIAADLSINPLYYKNIIDRLFLDDDNNVIYNNIETYFEKIETFGCLCESIKILVGKKNPKKPSKTQIKLMNRANWAREYCCKIEDYLKMIKESGSWSIVKNIVNEDTIKFNCIDERYLLKKHFHEKAGNCLYMSATIGEPINYINSIASFNNIYISIPSSFNFDKSPIYYDNEYKLSYDKKVENLPKIIKKIINIINNHKNIKGIIQTGSYAFADSLYNTVPEEIKNRLLIYNDSKNKEEKLDEFYKSTDKILIGPSLLEGIDLKDDLCRFIIVMKIPYPSLGDKFVERKSKMNPQWYIWKTVNALIQGIGRGVRNENDWCETYILDATLDNILLRFRNLIPQNILMRFRNVKV